MSYLSGVGYSATQLRSSQDLPSTLEYVSKERSGYAATWLRNDSKVYSLRLPAFWVSA